MSIKETEEFKTIIESLNTNIERTVKEILKLKVNTEEEKVIFYSLQSKVNSCLDFIKILNKNTTTKKELQNEMDSLG